MLCSCSRVFSHLLSQKVSRTWQLQRRLSILKENLIRVERGSTSFFQARYNGTWTRNSFSNASEPEEEKLTLVFDVERSSLEVWVYLEAFLGKRNAGITLQSNKYKLKNTRSQPLSSFGRAIALGKATAIFISERSHRRWEDVTLIVENPLLLRSQERGRSNRRFLNILSAFNVNVLLVSERWRINIIRATQCITYGYECILREVNVPFSPRLDYEPNTLDCSLIMLRTWRAIQASNHAPIALRKYPHLRAYPPQQSGTDSSAGLSEKVVYIINTQFLLSAMHSQSTSSKWPEGNLL